MQTFIIIAAGIFGLIVGSFLNVVIFRMGTGRGIGGRSMCLSCNRNLGALDLIPVVSFVLFRGKCRTCKSRISWQYPLVESVTAILFAVTTAFLFTIPVSFTVIVMLAAWLSICSIGMIIAVYDLRHRVIHFGALLALIFTILVLKIFMMWGIAFPVIVLNLAMSIGYGVIVSLPWLVLWFVSRGAWIGFGDIELIAVGGLLLGLTGGFSAAIIGFWVACAVILPIYAVMRYRGKIMNHQIPMGPFLLIGIWLVGIGGLDVVNWLVGMIH